MDKDQIISQATRAFEERYADFVALFDGTDFYNLVADEMRASRILGDGLDATRNNFTVENLVRDTEKLVVRLADRGALSELQKFGMTREAEEQFSEMRDRSNAIPRGAVQTRPSDSLASAAAPEPVATPSRWANFTQADFDRMSASEVKRLRNTDPAFVAAVARLDEGNVVDPNSTGRVFLRRRSDGFFFERWSNGVAQWTPSKTAWAHMDFATAHRYVSQFTQQGTVVDAYDTGTRRKVDVSPRAVQTMKDVQTASDLPWRFEPLNLQTAGKQRRHQFNRYLLHSDYGYVLQVDDAAHIVKVVPSPGNARAFTSRDGAIQMAESFPLTVWLCHGDGRRAA